MHERTARHILRELAAPDVNGTNWHLNSSNARRRRKLCLLVDWSVHLPGLETDGVKQQLN